MRDRPSDHGLTLGASPSEPEHVDSVELAERILADASPVRIRPQDADAPEWSGQGWPDR